MKSLPLGHVIDARYRIDAVISESDRAHVYAVTHLRFPEAELVLKVASLERMQDFERDTAVLASMTSSYVTRVCDHGGLPDGRLYRVVERLAGPTLREALLTSPFTKDRALELLAALTTVVHESQTNGIGPCDLSVDNLMFADGRSGKLCMLRALVPGARGPDPEAGPRALAELRVSLERGRDAAFGKTAWKPPEGIAELPQTMARTGGHRAARDREAGSRFGNWCISSKLSESWYATLYDVEGPKVRGVLKLPGPRTKHAIFSNHAEMLARVSSPHVVRVLEVGSFSGAPYMVMERLGPTHATRRERTVADAIETVDGILAGAIAVAHSGGGPCDLSLEHCHQASAVSKCAVITHPVTPGNKYGLLGKAAREHVDAWSGAVALYELLSARLPFPTSKHSLAKAWLGAPVPLGARRHDVPDSLSKLVNDVLMGTVRLTAQQLRDALATFRDISLATAPAAPALERENIHRVRVPAPPLTADWEFEVSKSRCPMSTLSAAAIGSDGREIVAVGRDSIARYQRGLWTLDPARHGEGNVRSLVPIDAGYLALTTTGRLLRLDAEGSFRPWGPTIDLFAFHGAALDGDGVILVGGRTDRRDRAVVARLARETLTIIADDLELPPLLSATRLRNGSLVATGRGGCIAMLREGTLMGSIRPCEVDVSAIGIAGTELVAIGDHAWAFRVGTTPLSAEPEAVDTLSNLTCLAIDEAGGAWAGSDKGRILHRRDRRWRRMNGNIEGDAAALAISATISRVRAVLANGRVVLGHRIA